MTEDIVIRTMSIDDYPQMKALWMTISGFGIRTIDDSLDGVTTFLKRNPTTSIVAVKDGEIVGTIMGGHDGRTASFYHVCVKKELRRQGIGTAMAVAAMRALQAEKINKITLIAYKKNEIGNNFWHKSGWVEREDINTYDFILNEENITNFNE